MAVFISHASRDRALATSASDALRADGLAVWVDFAEIGLGAPLDTEIKTHLRSATSLVLIWSAAAAASRWVNTEWLMAIQEGKFIVPCIADGAPLPQCLANTVHLDLSRDDNTLVTSLPRAVRAAPPHGNRLAPVMRSQEPSLRQAIDVLAEAQDAMLRALLERRLDEAERLQAMADDVMRRAEGLWRHDPMIANLGGYHRKNAYMLKHWDAIQAGAAPADPLLESAERRYLDALAIDPSDPSALNGIGTIYVFARHLDAAEAFQEWAIARAAERGIDYAAAKRDLEQVRRFKR